MRMLHAKRDNSTKRTSNGSEAEEVRHAQSHLRFRVEERYRRKLICVGVPSVKVTNKNVQK